MGRLRDRSCGVGAACGQQPVVEMGLAGLPRLERLLASLRVGDACPRADRHAVGLLRKQPLRRLALDSWPYQGQGARLTLASGAAADKTALSAGMRSTRSVRRLAIDDAGEGPERLPVGRNEVDFANGSLALADAVGNDWCHAGEIDALGFQDDK